MVGRSLALLVVLAAASQAQSSSVTQERQADNLAAFARMYGVVRYFYPGDAAAAVDWNRFAVHGANRVREAATAAELQTSLRDLFTPLGPGIEIGENLGAARRAVPDSSFVAWRYVGAGISTIGGPYRASRTSRATVSATNESAILTQSIPATGHGGKRIRLRGRAKLPEGSASGWAGLWLRIDRAPGQRGFFDNMGDRPISGTEWREYVIEGPIADDAVRIVFGALSIGAPVDVDAMELTVRSEGGEWTPVSISDAGFESPALSSWVFNVGTQNVAIDRLTAGAFEGSRFVRIETPKQMTAARAYDASGAPTFADVDLGSRLTGRVQLALGDADARRAPAAPITLAAAGDRIRGRDDVDVRVADVIVAWNAFRHFYPYFQEAQVDWDARLRSQLQAALRADATPDAHRNLIRAVVAEVRDGHGNVSFSAARGPRAFLPVQFRLLDGKAVVVSSRSPDLPVGSIVSAFDGDPVEKRFTVESDLASGTPQWRSWRAAQELASCLQGAQVRVSLELPTGAQRDVSVACASPAVNVEARPDSITELEPGVWYIDITRARMAQITPFLGRIAEARGLVVDMRGYPTDAGFGLLPHFVDAPENGRWMHVAQIDGPFGRTSGWQGFGWNVRPQEPRVKAKRIFLTDGRAISYAESIMGYVRDLKLGTIVGGVTAGANGNIASFFVPGGYTIVFTGMRVTRHDGVGTFHLRGVEPDIPMTPTLAGIRAGRDELLERATALLKPQP